MHWVVGLFEDISGCATASRVQEWLKLWIFVSLKHKLLLISALQSLVFAVFSQCNMSSLNHLIPFLWIINTLRLHRNQVDYVFICSIHNTTEFRCELKVRFTVILFFCQLHQENEEGTRGQDRLLLASRFTFTEVRGYCMKYSSVMGGLNAECQSLR